MSLNNQRLRLYGKPSTKEEIAKEVVRLRRGDPKHSVKACTVKEICQKLSFDSRQTVYDYLNYAEENDIAPENLKRELELQVKSQAQIWKKFSENHPITDDYLIQKWKRDMGNRKGGHGISSANGLINYIENFCNTLKINPVDLLQSKEQTEEYGWNFMELYKEGQAVTKGLYNPDVVDIANVRYTYAKATRDFMSFHNFSFRKGETGWFNQKIVGHGKYADIRFTDQDFIEADIWLKENYGLDSDEYRFFWIGVESCARVKALLKMSLDYEVSVNPLNPDQKCYVMTVFESKTKHIREGKWTKYITRPDTQKSIDLLKARGGYRLYDKDLKAKTAEKKVKDAMKKLLIHLGKITNIEELDAKRAQGYKKVGNYWYEHLGHFLRHIGAHYWLAKGHYTNHVFVAIIGGWNKVDELVDSYGAMPHEMILRGVFNVKEVSVA